MFAFKLRFGGGGGGVQGQLETRSQLPVCKRSVSWLLLFVKIVPCRPYRENFFGNGVTVPDFCEVVQFCDMEDCIKNWCTRNSDSRVSWVSLWSNTGFMLL